MCKRSSVGTYLKVNALPDNAQPCVFPVSITVGHFLLLRSGLFFIWIPDQVGDDENVITGMTGNPMN